MTVAEKLESGCEFTDCLCSSWYDIFAELDVFVQMTAQQRHTWIQSQRFFDYTLQIFHFV